MGKDVRYTIAPEVFTMFPRYRRGLLLVTGVENGASPPELVALLRDAEASVRRTLSIDDIAECSWVKAWRDAFKQLGVKPNEFRPSVEALARRALRGQLLPSISKLVDIGTVVSLRRLVPVGGHALDHIKHEIQLRAASGQETFMPFGSQQAERPDPGEFIFVDGNVVMTRRWVWRQAQHSILEHDTNAVVFNIDILLDVDEATVADIASDVRELVQRFCGGKSEYYLLSRKNPSIDLSP